MSRPAESASIVASIFAIATGCRWPRMKTEQPMRAFVVTIASALSIATGSRYGVSGGIGKRRPPPG